MKTTLCNRLNAAFFHRYSLQVARDLLGKFLVYGECMGQIVETEAYRQEGDASCHAAKGKTKRNASMFMAGGHLYVYGIHQVFCLNLVTEEEGTGCAVLIRTLQPLQGIEIMRQRRGPHVLDKHLTDGPGKLCQALGIDKSLDGMCFTHPQAMFWVEDRGIRYEDECIDQTPRIGISLAKDLLWRFYVPLDQRK